MTGAKRLCLIAAGYAAAAVITAFLVWVRYLFINPADVNASSGMYAGGDLVMFVLICGTLSLGPTFFLLRFLNEQYPRTLAAFLLAFSATGPISLGLLQLLTSGAPRFPGALDKFLGLAMLFLIFPRVVAIPVVWLGLGIALLLAREKLTRALLVCALALETLPLALIILHFVRTIPLP